MRGGFMNRLKTDITPDKSKDNPADKIPATISGSAQAVDKDFLAAIRRGINSDEELEFIAIRYYALSAEERANLISSLSGGNPVNIISFLKLIKLEVSNPDQTLTISCPPDEGRT